METRLAFCGSSGTGKSTLAKFVEERYGLPFNPVGSRSVALSLGFDNPYDVDAAGKRAEFQRRLVTEKVRWEAERESFVSDRTTADNLAYTMLHDVKSIDADILAISLEGLKRPTHIFYCPVEAFCQLDGDPSRLPDPTYHLLYDIVIRAFMERFRAAVTWNILNNGDLEGRKATVARFLDRYVRR